MTITVELPDAIFEGAKPARAALEALVLSGYRSGQLSKFQARVMLEMERLQFEDFLIVRGVHEFAYDSNALAEDMETAERLKAERNRAA